MTILIPKLYLLRIPYDSTKKKTIVTNIDPKDQNDQNVSLNR